MIYQWSGGAEQRDLNSHARVVIVVNTRNIANATRN
jgi:hypothetical protein